MKSIVYSAMKRVRETFSPLFILLAVVFFLSFLEGRADVIYTKIRLYPNVAMYQAVPEAPLHIATDVSLEDARIGALTDFFKMYRSPLTSYAPYFVSAADRYGFDFSLLPAIAMHESGLCKKHPEGSYNCFGFGVYGSSVLKFKGYEDAIMKVSASLSKDYIQKGYRTPQEIMEKYTPSSNGSWAESVSFYMDMIKTIL